MSRRIRLVDIAKRLGITKVSVSKALRGHPDISEATRKLVKEMAAEMGYSPNLVARSLSSQRSYTIGVVVPKIAHTFFAAVIDTIQARATEAGYGIVLAVSNETSQLERQHIERLLAMRVDGLLVSVSQEAPDRSVYERVRAMRMPLVFFDRKLDGLGFGSVTVDDWGGAYHAVEYAIEQGYTKIAHIAGTAEVVIGRQRREGYEAALEQHGLSLRPEWVIEGGFDERHGYDAFMRLLEGGELPEVLVAVSFPVGLGVRGAMREHAPALLDEIQITTFGQGGLNEFYAFPHTCVRQPTEAMGARAVEMLLARVEGTASEPGHEVLQTNLVAPGVFSNGQ